jgi:GNAT superfamily N-acetyltransferase
VLIRRAGPSDLPALTEIEAASGAAFADVGMVEIAEDAHPTVEELTPYQQAGRAWVAVDGLDQPIAYLIADEVDGCCHIEQVSVHPNHSGYGVGRALIDQAARWARDEGRSGLTLTTFAEVPWNAPYYLRHGFQIMSPGQITPGLRRIRQREAARGLDAWPRVCMWRAVAPVQQISR